MLTAFICLRALRTSVYDKREWNGETRISICGHDIRQDFDLILYLKFFRSTITSQNTSFEIMQTIGKDMGYYSANVEEF